jgi:tetratricopeptide (TPR) repeat protein
MNPADQANHAVESPSSVLAELVDRLTVQMQAGEVVPWEEVLRQHPEHAGELRRLRQTLEALDELSHERAEGLSGLASSAATGGLAPGVLGDFRLLREIGRGGMGVVYEAEQVSLGRAVALKVLPFAATMDTRHLQRFHNEARAAGCLHHEHIVPVYSVGCERGVHYYAMQLIEGRTLAAVIHELRQQAGLLPAPRAVAAAPAVAVGSGEPTVAHVPAGAALAGAAETVARVGLSTERSGRGRDYYRTVARLGVQSAQALEHAHERGVVHRDVKPANLMLDGRGNVWVTDFGLAHLQHAEGSLTMSGDLVGTLRYMSPEQALARRVVIDHRTDVYSLGATLYELLTLRPAFDGSDRQELLRQVAFEEPAAPRKLDRGVPAELETIVLKAMEKNPHDRYGTAQELADDLRRFLDDRPIQARRPSLRQVAAKWARRHRAVVWAAAAVLLIAAVLGGGTGLWWGQKRVAAQGDARAELLEAIRLQEQEKWTEGLGAIRRAKGALAGVWADPALIAQVEDRGRDLKMALLLQEARLQGTAVKDGHFDGDAASQAYADAFAWYGLAVDDLDPQEAGERIAARSIRTHLVGALDDWAILRAGQRRDWRHLLAVSQAVDPARWRYRLRDALARATANPLMELPAFAGDGDLPSSAVRLFARFAQGPAEAEQTLVLLRRQRQRHPDDFWANHALATCLQNLRPPRLEEAICYCTTAVALRPQSPGARVNLGVALQMKGRHDEAILEFQEAIRLKGDYAAAYTNLGSALYARGKLDEAVELCKKALALDPRLATAHSNLGNALRDKGKVDEAIECFHRALALDPKDASAHTGLGNALLDKGRVDEAIAEYREVIRLRPDLPLAHYNLGNALVAKGKLGEAIACYERAIAINPRYGNARTNLGAALRRKGKVEEAIACLRKAIALDLKDAVAHVNLGNALRDKGKVDEAIECYRQAIALDPKYANAHTNLAFALKAKGKVEEAIACYRKAIALDPKDVVAHHNLALVLKDKGQVDEAIVCLRKAIEIDPKLALAHTNLGLALKDKGKVEEAIAACRQAIALDPDFADAHYNLGNALDARGKRAEAEAAYRQAITLKPDYAQAHCNLGMALYGKGKVDEAIAEYREAIRLKPALPQAHTNLGIALYDRGKVDEAIALYQRAIAVDLKYAPAHFSLGVALHGKGRVEEAIVCLRKAIELDPKHALVYTNLGAALSDKGEVEEAIACFQKAIALDPKLAMAHNNLGNALYKQRKLDEAIACWRKAIELDPKHALAHYNLGTGLQARGRVEEAIACLHRAIALDPKYPSAHGVLGQALIKQGQFHKAQEALQRCLGLLLPSDPMRDYASRVSRQCQQLIDADAKLKAFLAGKEAPADAATQVQMAELAWQPFNRCFLAAVRLYRDAFARQPRLAHAHRYIAARVAALAGCGPGKGTANLSEQERARLRQQALDWLHADLKARRTHLRAGSPAVAGQARKALKHWRQTDDLAGVRDKAPLARLPAAERQAWQQLWADVAEALASARRATSPRQPGAVEPLLQPQMEIGHQP